MPQAARSHLHFLIIEVGFYFYTLWVLLELMANSCNQYMVNWNCWDLVPWQDYIRKCTVSYKYGGEPEGFFFPVSVFLMGLDCKSARRGVGLNTPIPMRAFAFKMLPGEGGQEKISTPHLSPIAFLFRPLPPSLHFLNFTTPLQCPFRWNSPDWFWSLGHPLDNLYWF